MLDVQRTAYPKHVIQQSGTEDMLNEISDVQS